MPNGKTGDSPLSDFTIHGIAHYPPDIMGLLDKINRIGREQGRWPLGENWPFGHKDDVWARGEQLEEARAKLTHLLTMLEAGRGDEILLDPRTHRPFKEG